jgi:hypothetical protein
MRTILTAALALAGIAALADVASANSSCEERRNACYSAIGEGSGKDAENKCDAEYDRCIAADPSAKADHPVSPVTGLGRPMVQPYPTGAPPVNFAATPSGPATLTANARAARTRKPPVKTASKTLSAQSKASATAPGKSSSNGSRRSGSMSSSGHK